MFKVILWDIDNTLLDFTAAEKNSLKACFKKHNLGECSDEMINEYSDINRKHWEMLERGEISKKEILVNRFKEFFSKNNIDISLSEEFNSDFEKGLADYVVFIENSYEILKNLKGKYKQYAVTNGAYEVQSLKLKKSGFDKLFDGAFISDEVGFEKPSIGFFNFVLDNLEPCSKDEILIIGDSLTSDMKGGNNIGIKCCRYNPINLENPVNLKIDYNINKLEDIYNILGGF